MDQLRSFADDRLIQGCIYCGGPEETKDHVPSRVFLDEPYPDNFPVVPACFACNNSFSVDEQYLACLLEAVVAGSTDPGNIRRPRISESLRMLPALRARLEQAKRTEHDRVSFAIEPARVERVLLKLAQGHAAFELDHPCGGTPEFIRWWPFLLMNENDKLSFDSPHPIEMFPEVGSRAMQRLVRTEIAPTAPNRRSSGIRLVGNWVNVQVDRYRYLAIDGRDGVTVKILVAGYLACEVHWKP